MTAATADFGGYATKNDLVCMDGRTIKSGAFAHQDKMRIPLVYQHQHTEPENVLGHAILENREDGVYAYGYFNDTPRGRHSKAMVEHGDIVALSIYADKLLEQSKNVLHGNIRELSLVLSGANPGALIDNVYIRHGDNVIEVDGEAIIYTDEPVEQAPSTPDLDSQPAAEVAPVHTTDTAATTPEVTIQHADTKGATVATDTSNDEKTIKQIFDEMTEEQKNVVYYMIGAAIEDGEDTPTTDGAAAQSGLDEDDLSTITHGIATDIIDHLKESSTMPNVFETHAGTTSGGTLRHSSMTPANIATILENAKKLGSVKEAVLQHAGTYGIDNIDVLFPDAKAITNSPDIIGRRTEWVASVINGTKHSPFARIKSTAADITADEARAKGYVKGALKKDEIIKLLRRITVPTTIYKKQKLDRDDVVDITDLDVVAWLKAEMRLMLEEELAGAILVGDGRASDDADKIDEDHIRPIAYDADMYAHQVVVASDLNAESLLETILRSRTNYKGTGTPTLYTTDANLTDMLLIKDRNRRRVYNSVEELAAALRVREIVPVEIMDRTPDVVAIIVNLADYTVGADQGGNINLFDDFDIDFNQLKYLIETRVSGALTKPKSALVIKRTLGTVVTPIAPSFDGVTNTITIPAVEGVVYSIDGVTVTGNVVIDSVTDVEARPATGYSFPANTGRNWVYVP